METIKTLSYVLTFCIIILINSSAFANNITIFNYSLTDRNVTNHSIMVKFDISWENSWRTSLAPNNWDAAWVFVKYRVGTGEWQNSWLNNTGHINPTGSTITTGLLDPTLPFNQTTNPGIGAFIYSNTDGTGTFTKRGVQLRWNYGANGLADNAVVDIRVYTIEMVYVPQDNFFIGSGGNETASFYKYPVTTNPYLISGEGAITVGTANDNLYYSTGFSSGDQLGPIPTAFPKGYKAFYCMKYEISQQAYVDFLNSLTQTQANIRKYTSTSNRYAITGSTIGNYATNNPFVACNYLSWADLAAYLDWSGLRPMTELEFEKACRGTQATAPNEYAWGTTGIANNPYTLNNSGLSNEYISSNYSTTDGNAAFPYTTPLNGDINGPVRVGIFAGNGLNTGRITSGGTYYGIMEMSGNVWERPVTVGNPTGRTFTGANGNGLLTATGEADVSNWPGITGLGACFRGGCWNDNLIHLRVSHRDLAAYDNDTRIVNSGGRGIRVAP